MKRHILGSLLVVSSGMAVLACMSGAYAQAYPSKPIKLYSGFAPGGGVDVVARTMATVMSAELGQQIVLEHRVGAGGTLATAAVAKAEPDGYSILVSEHSSVVYMQLLLKDLPYDPYRDLAIITPVFKAGFIIVGGPALPASINSLADLIRETKASPGKIAYGHSGSGTLHHLTMELLKLRAGINLTAVAYKGGAQSITDVVGGQIPLVISGQNTTDPQINAGKIRAIAISADTRWSARPTVPTISETLPGFTAYSWASMFVPAGTPRDIMQKLNSAALKALRDPETAKRLSGMGLEPPPRSLEEANQLWQAERTQWFPVVKQLNLKLD